MYIFTILVIFCNLIFLFKCIHILWVKKRISYLKYLLKSWCKKYYTDDSHVCVFHSNIHKIKKQYHRDHHSSIKLDRHHIFIHLFSLLTFEINFFPSVSSILCIKKYVYIFSCLPHTDPKKHQTNFSFFLIFIRIFLYTLV